MHSKHAVRTYLSYHLGRLSVINCFQILLHGTIIVLPLVLIVSIFSEDDILLLYIHTRFLGQIYCSNKHVALIHNLQSLLEGSLVIAVDLIYMLIAIRIIQMRSVSPCHLV